MQNTETSYDPRYLAGIVLFNRGDFFEAHEVWEELWMDTHGTDRQFFQGLIQAAVGLCHFCNGNVRGAVKLYHSSLDYLSKYPSPYFGLDLDLFRAKMKQCFAELVESEEPQRGVEIKEELIPEMELDPPPDSWPDPEEYLEED